EAEHGVWAGDGAVGFNVGADVDFAVHPARIVARWTNWGKVTFSARICGESPTCSKAAVSLSAGQSCFNSFIIILRRWEKLSFTKRVKTFCFSTGSRRFSRRFRLMHMESTSGGGKKQSAGILKWLCGS